MLKTTDDRPDANHPAPLRLALLADDLTGACDAAAPFSLRGFRTEVGVARHATPSAACEVWSCSSESRDGEIASLERTLARSLDELPAAPTLFKKVDSVFRGNTVAEIATIRRLRPAGVGLLAPAFPHAGRIVRNGVLQIEDLSGTCTVPLFDKLREQGLPVHGLAAGRGAQALREELSSHTAKNVSGSLLLCDTESQEDLDALVEAASELADPLWIGSAGLAHALAKSWGGALAAEEQESGPPQETAKPVLFFIGSTHPVTQAQVQTLAPHRERHAHVQVVEVPRGPAAREIIQDAAWGLRPEEVGCLFVTGGDTASEVFAALRITALHVVDEFAPGLPLCRAIGGRLDGVPVLLKSGGFGKSTVLCEIAERFGVASTPRRRSSL